MVLLPLLSLCSRLFAKDRSFCRFGNIMSYQMYPALEDDWPCPSKILFSELDQRTESLALSEERRWDVDIKTE